jgi:predicted MPP superfamily phosphohydrolase
MSVLLQLSDSHFGTEQAPVVEALAALAQHQQPDLLVLSGDITQRATRSQFAQARAFTDRLGAPLLAIPGNHDIPLFDLGQRLLHPYARYREAFGNVLEPTHASRELLVQCVNTTRWYRHKGGTVSSSQIERVASRLRAAQPSQLRVVVVHQPIAVLRATERHNLLHGHTEAQQSWAAAGCDVVLGGHIHLPYVMALAGLARPMWVVQAGTAVSRRVRAGAANSVNVLRWGGDTAPGCCLIEQWDYTAATHAFVCTGVTEIHPAHTSE